MNINSGMRWYPLLVLLIVGFTQFSYGEIVIKTFHDANNNGLFDQDETLLGGLTVTAVDQQGNSYSFIDDGHGLFKLAIVPSRMRVQVMGYNSSLRQGVSGPTSIFFAYDGEQINVPVLKEFAINSQNTLILVPCFEKGSAANKVNSPALVAFPYLADGVAQQYGGNGPNPRMDASIAQIGSTWGLAYQTSHKRAFVSSILKRHVDLGPDGPGGIYIADYSMDAEKPLISSINLEGFHPSVGPIIELGSINRTILQGEITELDPFALTTIEDPLKRASYDLDAFHKVGQLSYGDCDLTEDDKQLWLVNTHQRSLISLDVSQANLNITSNALRHYLIDDLLNIPNTDFRLRRCINAGGNKNYQGAESFTDHNSIAWDRNKYSLDGTADYKDFVVSNTMNTQEGTSQSELYHTWRKGRNFSYEIPIPKEENYKVILHFAEPNHYAAGDRTFDIIADGITVFDNFDVVAKAGAHHKAITVSFDVKATGPTLRLDFKGEISNKVREAFINGIEIIGTSMIKSGYLRPWGLDFHNGRGYLGLVNDAMITQSRDHMMGYVVSFDPNHLEAGVTEEVSFALSYPRERASNADTREPQALRTSAWLPWVENWEQTHIPLDDRTSFTGGLLCAYPQPMISEINFTEDGSMVISIMDRWAHQTGYMNYSTLTDEKTLIIGYASGDIIKAFKQPHGYVVEASNNDDGLFYNKLDGPSYQGEFFYQDEYQSRDVAHHGELVTGGASILLGTKEVVTTVHNPIETTLEHFNYNGVFTQGLHYYSTETGKKTRAYLFVDQFNIGKANGLGDLEFATGSPFGEVGNYLWCDANANGIQDATEYGIANIELTLHDQENSLQLVGTVISDAAGHFVFHNLLPNRCYEIRVNLNQLVSLGYSGLIAPLQIGSNGMIDSDADPNRLPGYAVSVFCTDQYANNLHDVDFGFLGPRALEAFKSACEAPITGCATFLLSDLAACVDTSGVNEVRFFPSFHAADSMLNELTNSSILVCDGSDTIYARVNIAGDLSCFSIALVRLVEINDGSEPLSYTATVCPSMNFDAQAYLTAQGLTGGSMALLYLDEGLSMPIANPVATPVYPTIIYFTSMETAGTTNCLVRGSIIIHSIAPPAIDAGNPLEGCGLNCIDLTMLGASFSANGSGATAAVWTSSGNGTFTTDNSFAHARFYCPDTMDMLNGSVLLTLTVIDDPCNRVIEDTVRIRIQTSLPRFIHPESPDTIDCIHPFVNDQVNYDTFPRCELVINCGDTIRAHVVDYKTVLGSCQDIVKLIIRTQRVHYNKVEYFCTDTIYIRGLDFDNFVCPPMKDSVYCHTGYLKDNHGHPSPYVTGVPMAGNVPLWPQPNSKCELLILYKDEVFTGDCPITIHRTWWIKNSCNGRVDTCDQWIMIFDTIGPTITKDSSYLNLAPPTAFPQLNKPIIFVPTNAHDCEAYSYVPAIYALDTCSDVKSVKATIPGVATVQLMYNPLNQRWESHKQIKIPRSETPVPLIYEAFDFCHNLTRDTCYFYVKDLTKPVTICDKAINVTLSDTTVWLNADIFNEGSWDNCGIALMLARRTDWATACGVNLCDSILPYCITDHQDTLWCSVLEKDKHLNPVEAHYAETLRWLCEDGQDCSALMTGGWYYDLIRRATLDCIDHPYPVDDRYLEQILKDASLSCQNESHSVGDLCEKLEYGFMNNLTHFSAPQMSPSFSSQVEILKQIGGGWSKEVPFCCADACQNVTVELLVMDYWCNWSKCWTTVYVEDKKPPKVINDLFDISITCASYKTFYEDAVSQAQQGDFRNLDSLLGGYDKVRNDAYHGLPVKTPFKYYNLLCDSVLVKKDSLVYDEHLGYHWVSYNHYESVYDTVIHMRHHGQIADDCGLICLEEKPWVSLDVCGSGFVKRVFKFIGQCQVESSGHKIDTITRYQTIWIQSDCNLNKSMFKMPEDQVLYHCELKYDASGSGQAGGAADPVYTGKPVYVFDTDCRQLGIGYYDKVFKIVGGQEGCYKIIRTWCMADWCVIGKDIINQPQWWFNPNYEGKYLSWEQKILLIDTVPPSCQINIPDTLAAAGCLYDLVTTIPVNDNCSVIDYSWELSDKVVIQLGHGSGQIDQSSGIPVKVDQLPAGHYTLKIYLSDECQNQHVATKDFIIEPRKKPTPVCLTNLSIQLNPMDIDNDGQIDTAMAMLWASDLNQGSIAACGSLSTDLKFRIDRVSNSDSALPITDQLTFGCDDIGVVPIRMYVLDASGTWDFCEVTLTVQDNQETCGTEVGNGRISGVITNELNRIVHAVDLALTDPSGYIISQEHVSGGYQFEMSQGKNAYLIPYKNSDPLNGVSTRDLIDIQKHLLGIDRLDSWYTRQAADINADGDISVIDLIQLRKLILGMNDEFPENTSWRFFDKVTHQERYHINPMRDIMQVDFMGVKIGDVNLDSDPSRKSARTSRSLKLVLPDQYLYTGNHYDIPVRSKDFSQISGMQYTLQYDPSKLRVKAVESGQTLLQANLHTNLNHPNQGWLTALWYNESTNPITLNDDSEILILKVVALDNARVSDLLSISSNPLEAEAYQGKENMPIALEFEQSALTFGSFELYQNVPNPFSHQTAIGFKIPESTVAKLTVYDVTGRVLKEIKTQVTKGYHEWILNQEDLPSSGILYYKMETEKDAALRKMLLITR